MILVQVLVQDYKANINATDANMNTPLHYAAKSGNQRLVKMILKRNPILDIANRDGQTVLQLDNLKSDIRHVSYEKSNLNIVNLKSFIKCE